jgi:hypothetical protein
MTRALSIALRVVIPALAVAALAVAVRGFPTLQDEGDLKHAQAGREPVAQVATVRVVGERRHDEILAEEPPSGSLADPAQPTTGARAQRPGPSLGRDEARNGGGIQGSENRQQPNEPRIARATWWWPFGGGSSAATTPVDTAVSPTPPAPRPAPGSGSASNPAALVELLAITRSGQMTAGESFAVNRMRDLRILVWWNVAGQHVQRLELLSPDGSLYQKFATAFDADTAKFEQHGNHAYLSIETMLPVAGTWITEHSLFGAWIVNVYLDEGDTPFTTASFFVSES